MAMGFKGAMKQVKKDKSPIMGMSSKYGTGNGLETSPAPLGIGSVPKDFRKLKADQTSKKVASNDMQTVTTGTGQTKEGSSKVGSTKTGNVNTKDSTGKKNAFSGATVKQSLAGIIGTRKEPGLPAKKNARGISAKGMKTSHGTKPPKN